MNVKKYFRIHWVVKEITGLKTLVEQMNGERNKLNLFEHAIIVFYYYYIAFYNSHQHIVCF